MASIGIRLMNRLRQGEGEGRDVGLRINMPKPKTPEEIAAICERARLQEKIVLGSGTADVVFTAANGNSLYVGGCDCLTKPTNIPNLSGVVSLYPTSTNQYTPPFMQVSINIQDWEGENIGQHFEETNMFIQSHLERGNVLVHCQAGISRSVTIASAFLMRAMDCSADLAVAMIQSQREQAKPNDGFMAQLKAYEML